MNKNQIDSIDENLKNKEENSETEKKYLENTLCCFIFGILGIIIPIFLFSVVSMHYAKLHKYEKLAKLHNVGAKLSQIGVVVSGLFIVIMSILSHFL